MSEQGKQVQIRVMGADGEWFTPARNADAIVAALAAIGGDIEEMAGDYSDHDLRRIRQELGSLNMTVARRVAILNSKPMKASELGGYVCVAHGGCLHASRTISTDGVWVRSPDPDPLHPGSHVYSSAHRDCYERWAEHEQEASRPVLNEERAYLILTAIDPVTWRPLMSPDDAHQMLRTATHHGIATWRDGGWQVTVTSNDGVFFNISTLTRLNPAITPRSGKRSS